MSLTWTMADGGSFRKKSPQSELCNNRVSAPVSYHHRTKTSLRNI